MDAWKLTDEEVAGLVTALTSATKTSKHGQRMLADLITVRDARKRVAEEDAQWDSK